MDPGEPSEAAAAAFEDSAFVRPRYLLGFSATAGADLVSQVKSWLEAAGLAVDLEYQPAKAKQDGLPEAPFLVVSAGRRLLEQEAERLGCCRAHSSLRPHVEGQGLGSIEFSAGLQALGEGYDGYASPDFWRACERAQLLGSLIEGVRVQSAEQQRSLCTDDEAALTVAATTGLVAALRMAGHLDALLPLDDDTTGRSGIWWAGWLSWRPPADALQQYFGAEVAFYFSWLAFFTDWLWLPAAGGALCTWHMRAYGYTVDDHPYVPFHGLFVVLWSVAFLCCWDRACAAQAWRWGTLQSGPRFTAGAAVRPGFRGTLRTSRATGMQERHFPYVQRLAAYVVSLLVTLAMLCVAFLAMVCSLNLQGYMEEHATTFEKAFYIGPLARLAQPGAVFDPEQTRYFGLLALVPTVLHILAISQLNKLYRAVAERLTELENHRHWEQHRNSLVAKRFAFEAFDCYISLFYLGFVQQDMQKLRAELMSLYTVDSLRRVVCEVVLPLAAKQFSGRRAAERAAELKKQDQGQLEEALEVLEQEDYEQFDDYLEMVIEFGYITLFASAFPLAALLSILCNAIEAKSDLFKLSLSRLYRRPPSRPVATIEVWRRLLQVIVVLSIGTNVMLFCMSEQLAAWAPSLYREARQEDLIQGRVAELGQGEADLVMKKGMGRYVVLTAFGLEHLVALAALGLSLAIPRLPEWLAAELRRRAWDRRQLLQR